ncbi:MAG: RNA-binding transcriptional accessory protein [Clostridia bacterium]|nr:RNA-binding transcriptional accessory protein [Clostridia bacterium]MBQ4629342.1 RNA-binding transcriptional accessory protein [Clostridia bacterium]
MNINEILCSEFKIKKDHLDNIVNLIDDGNTIPFIARYRKEMTGSCDDQVLREIADRLEYLRNLEKRKQEVSDSIIAQEKMTDEIAQALAAAETLSAVEDIYRPFKQKRRTKASIAKEKGLEPLATVLLAQEITSGDLIAMASEYIDEEKGVATAEEALEGASDIIAEIVSDDPEVRKQLKELIQKEAVITSKQAKEGESVYTMYYDYSEPVKSVPSHRILAINRGENEEWLSVSVGLSEDRALKTINDLYIKQGSISTEFVENAIKDSYNRLIFPSVERETRSGLTEKADEQAIKMFGLNLKPLLMQPPVKGKTVLAVDPAYRTGCKICAIDENGKVLMTDVIYPTPPQSKIAEAAEKVKKYIAKFNVDCISIGNGTASKETEIFIADTIRDLDKKVTYMVVNEAGASVYSASKLGAEEFPEFDVSLRSAVSIGRRLQDPLAELVKIDPKSIGVGQYQHDMPQARLDAALSGVVEGCVNSVGVDINTASPSLLSYVAGINSAIAKNIVAYRDENGAFRSRKEFLKVKKLGPKAFEQCAGFLRIPGAENPLDNTAVHPESYSAAEKLLGLFGYTPKDVTDGGLTLLTVKLDKYGKQKAADDCGIGLPTLNDIITEILKPGRDIRDELPPPLLRSDVMDIKDLKEGMVFTGTVRNVIDFGVFVDIGVHQDGLVHISQVADRYIKHPSEVVKVGDIVNVKILGVDVAKKRISLTMKTK